LSGTADYIRLNHNIIVVGTFLLQKIHFNFYFQEVSIMKKSMAVLLTAAMGAALLTGCGSSSSTATTAATTTAAPAS